MKDLSKDNIIENVLLELTTRIEHNQRNRVKYELDRWLEDFSDMITEDKSFVIDTITNNMYDQVAKCTRDDVRCIHIPRVGKLEISIVRKKILEFQKIKGSKVTKEEARELMIQAREENGKLRAIKTTVSTLDNNYGKIS